MVALLAAGTAVGYGGLLGLLYAAQRRLLFFPDRAPARPEAWNVADMAPIVVRTVDGLDLTGWHRPPSRAGLPTVVLFHGNAGHLGMRGFKARHLLDAGFGVLLAGYRGYGGNPGQPSEDGLYADARAFLDRMGEAPVVVYGESLGTGVAVQMAVERRVAGVVLEAPYTSVPDIGAMRFPWAPVRLLMRDRFDSLAKIGRIRAPLLIVHGERDRTIPIRFGRRLFEAAAEPKRAAWLPAAGHNDVYDHGAFEIVRRFLEELA